MSSPSNNQSSPQNGQGNPQNPNHQDFIDAVNWSRECKSKHAPKNESEKEPEKGVNWLYVVIAAVIIIALFFAINYFYKKPALNPNPSTLEAAKASNEAALAAGNPKSSGMVVDASGNVYASA